MKYFFTYAIRTEIIYDYLSWISIKFNFYIFLST